MFDKCSTSWGNYMTPFLFCCENTTHFCPNWWLWCFTHLFSSKYLHTIRWLLSLSLPLATPKRPGVTCLRLYCPLLSQLGMCRAYRSSRGPRLSLKGILDILSRIWSSSCWHWVLEKQPKQQHKSCSQGPYSGVKSHQVSVIAAIKCSVQIIPFILTFVHRNHYFQLVFFVWKIRSDLFYITFLFLFKKNHKSDFKIVFKSKIHAHSRKVVCKAINPFLLHAT